MRVEKCECDLCLFVTWHLPIDNGNGREISKISVTSEVRMHSVESNNDRELLTNSILWGPRLHQVARKSQEVIDSLWDKLGKRFVVSERLPRERLSRTTELFKKYREKMQRVFKKNNFREFFRDLNLKYLRNV